MTRHPIFLFLCFAVAFTIAWAQEPMQNLVPNPGFEEGKNSPDGWIAHHLISGEWAEYSKAEWTMYEVHSGKKSIKVTVTKNPNRTLGWRILEEKPVPIKGGSRIKVSGWMKTKDVVMGATDYNVPCITMLFWDAKGKIVQRHWIARATAPETDWTKYEEEILLKDNVTSFTVSCGLGSCTGTAWFDDISIVYADPPAVPVGLSSSDKILTDDSLPVIIPKPWKETYGSARYEIDNIALVWDGLPENRRAKDTLQKYLAEITEEDIPVFSMGEENAHTGLLVVLSTWKGLSLGRKYLADIEKNVSFADIGPQGYVLVAGNDGKRTYAILSGASAQGTAYAVETFKQYLVKKDNKWFIPEGTIIDKPSFTWRGLVPGGTSIERIDRWMIPLKVNVIYSVPSLGYEWWKPLTGEYKEMLKKWVANCEERFITPVGGTRPDRGYVRRIKFSDPTDVEAVLNIYRDYYECGVRNFHIAFDDGPSRLEYSEDINIFQNDIAAAHLSLAEKVYKLLKRMDTSATFTLCPLHYYSPLDWSPQQLAYIKTLSQLSADVPFINCASRTRETAAAHQRITGRQALFWDNWAADFEGMNPFPNIFPPPAVKNDPQLPELVKGYQFPLLDKEMMWYLAADYMWNADRYDPEESRARALRKMCGSRLVGSLVEYEKFITANVGLPLSGNTREERIASAYDLIKQMEQYRTKLVPLVPADMADNIEKTVGSKIALLKDVFLPQLNEHPFPMSVPFTNSPPVINGALDDACWSNALVLNGFKLPLAGFAGVSFAAVQTEVRLLNDRNYLYLLFTCQEPSPEKMRARMTERDMEIYSDDSVEIMISQPGQPYYHIAVNSLGTLYDAKEQDAAWNAEITGIARTSESSWTVEVSIPLSALNVKWSPGIRLAFNFFRARHAGEKPEFSSWSVVQKRFHEPERFWLMELADVRTVR